MNVPRSPRRAARPASAPPPAAEPAQYTVSGSPASAALTYVSQSVVPDRDRLLAERLRDRRGQAEHLLAQELRRAVVLGHDREPLRPLRRRGSAAVASADWYGVPLIRYAVGRALGADDARRVRGGDEERQARPSVRAAARAAPAQMPPTRTGHLGALQRLRARARAGRRRSRRRGRRARPSAR